MVIVAMQRRRSPFAAEIDQVTRSAARGEARYIVRTQSRVIIIQESKTHFSEFDYSPDINNAH